jgi:Protein of unknown function (DUF2934)
MLPLRRKPQEAGGIARVGVSLSSGQGALNGVRNVPDVEQTIRERAYQLWTETGCHDGHAETHWLTAQQGLLSASVGEIGRASVGAISDANDEPKKARTSRKRQRAA